MQVNIAHIGARIKAIRTSKNLTQEEFALSLGVSRSTLSQIEIGAIKPSIDMIAILASKHKIPLTYIFEGKVEKGTLATLLTNDNAAEYGRSGVPLINVEAVGGGNNNAFSIQEKDIKAYYVVPDFVNINFMMRVTGSSMYPKYSSGDVVACRIIKEKAFIQWGKVYVIATKEQGILIKRLKKSEKKNHILAISDNTSFDAFDVPLNEIDGFALVVGVIRLE